MQLGAGLPAVHSFSENSEVTSLFISSAHLDPPTDVPVIVWANLPSTEFNSNANLLCLFFNAFHEMKSEDLESVS